MAAPFLSSSYIHDSRQNMTNKSDFHVLTIALFLLLTVTATNAAGTELDQPADIPGVADAQELINNGKFDEALDTLRALSKTHPNRTDVLFLLGLAAIERSEQPDITEADRKVLLADSITALRTILIDRPDLVRVRLELARAFFLNGDDGLARDNFERVLAGNPPPSVVVNVQLFLDSIRARRRWSTYLGAALLPSTNIGRDPHENTIITVPGLPDFPFRPDETRKSGVGISVWAGGQYYYPLADRVRLLLGSDTTLQQYPGKKFDRMSLSGHVGPNWQAGRNTEISLLANVRKNWVAASPYSSDVGVKLQVGHRLTRRIYFTGQAYWQRSDYRTSKFLDGPLRDFSLYGNWLITPTVRAEAGAGYARQRPNDPLYHNTSRWGRIGVSVILPRGFTLGARYELRRKQYKGGSVFATLDGLSRRDRTRILRASVYNRAFTLYGFSPQLTITNEAQKSNGQFHNYKSTSAEFSFVRQF